MRREALASLRPGEAEHLKRGRSIEQRAINPQPVVERIFRPSNCALCTIGKVFGHFKSGLLQISVLDAQRHKADTLSLFAGERFAGQKIIFRFRKAAQQRPNNAGDIAGRNAKSRMTVDDAGRLSRDRNVREYADNETRADRNPVDRRNDRLVAVDDVVDKVLGLLPSRHSGDGIVEDALDQLEVASCRKGLAGPGNDNGVDIGIVIDVAPDVGQLPMRLGVD